MRLKLNVRREVKIGAVLITLFALIAFTERMKSPATLSSIRISILNIHENHFLEESDIMRLMRLDEENVRGVDLNMLNFSELERKLRESPYIERAELFSDLKGTLMVNVTLRRPVARMVQSDGPDAYVGEDGTVMPVSGKFAARVLLISGDVVKRLIRLENVKEDEEGKQLMELVRTIKKDEFWNAQISQIDVDTRGNVAMFPQVGDERIEFGKPEGLEKKFRKLKIFYKEILPRVGWNKYDRVNVAYEGQVVAE
jgi:cell division protein FtsQ